MNNLGTIEAGARERRSATIRRVFTVSLILTLWLGLHSPLQGGSGTAGKKTPSSPVQLRIDPRLIAEATEVWALITARKNPVWPGWNASATPLLFYLPGEQDVLINHPHPPTGFLPYTGPVRFSGGRIMVRNGPTLVEWDGQNTSLEIEGVPTLVAADTLSSLKLQVRSLLEAPLRPGENPLEPGYAQLSADPYDQLALIVHEAFHVFQDRTAPDKAANEMLLLRYPLLAADNNVDFALEGAALAAALQAPDPAAFRGAVVRWLALRAGRRAKLPAEAAEYEDGTEFYEGLAKYTEYRLFEALEHRTPAPAMGWVQGFHGYGDLSGYRSRLVADMVRHMRGEVPVNNDPYGTAPLRMRLYYSGMAIAAILDRLDPDWKSRILQPGVSLTGLVSERVNPSGSELSRALAGTREGADYQVLLAAKAQLAREGRARIDAVLVGIESGAGTGVIVDYRALESSDVRLAFTPFGIQVVDDDRTIFTQVPVQVQFADGSGIAQHEPMPLLQDKKGRTIRFRLQQVVPAGQAEKAAGVQSLAGQELAGLTIDLPGATLRVVKAAVRWEGRDLRIELRPSRK